MPSFFCSHYLLKREEQPSFTINDKEYGVHTDTVRGKDYYLVNRKERIVKEERGML